MIGAILAAALTAYLLGNLNGSVCISALVAHDDVRKHGSGNAGLTNFFRSYGGWSTFLVMAGDMLKTVAAAYTAGWALASFGYYREGLVLGVVAVSLGHDFPALLGFKGGKGILSGWFIAFMIDWRIGAMIGVVFFAAYLLTQYVSLGSVLSSGSFGFIYAYFHWGSWFPIAVGFFLSFLLMVNIDFKLNFIIFDTAVFIFIEAQFAIIQLNAAADGMK